MSELSIRLATIEDAEIARALISELDMAGSMQTPSRAVLPPCSHNRRRECGSPS
jgi:hypothetical protein